MQQTVELPQLLLIDKFGSRASCYAATGADGPDNAVGMDMRFRQLINSMMSFGYFFKTLHTGTGSGAVFTGTRPP